MAGQGQIFKYFAGIIMAVLLTHECVVETLPDFPETNEDIEFSYIDGQLHHRLPRSTELLEFILVVEVNASQAVVIEQIRVALTSITFPLQLDNNTEITAANVTTVCQSNVTKYQCVCEGGYAWTYNNCKTYEACDDISLGSCGCISGIPSDGELCVLKSDTDECRFSPSTCGPNSNCTNEMGSYNCSCLDGFTATNSNLTISINNTCRAARFRVAGLSGFRDGAVCWSTSARSTALRCSLRAAQQYVWLS
ncbi:adhesion G protein-coupled receptor E2-like [Pseudorasbora parva]|uniref:adhesion G protein-coupled receptor E2-like n=1 Tax=Pseudorasbora parva TaxID=51549 RepID=UPI00351EFCC5